MIRSVVLKITWFQSSNISHIFCTPVIAERSQEIRDSGTETYFSWKIKNFRVRNVGPGSPNIGRGLSLKLLFLSGKETGATTFLFDFYFSFRSKHIGDPARVVRIALPHTRHVVGKGGAARLSNLFFFVRLNTIRINRNRTRQTPSLLRVRTTHTHAPGINHANMSICLQTRPNIYITIRGKKWWRGPIWKDCPAVGNRRVGACFFHFSHEATS